VLCLVAFAMTIARSANLATRPRIRIHSFAVWTTAVFLLNVLAFLLMGLQARTIVTAMEPDRLRAAALFATAGVATLFAVRMAWVLLNNMIARRFKRLVGDPTPANLRQGLLVGWSGMRGLVTLATAFALPQAFPQRDLIVLTAFAVVIATLVVQGLTLVPLVRLLKLDGEDGLAAELAAARTDMATAALAAIDGKTGPAVDHWRYSFELTRAAADGAEALNAKRKVGRAALRRQRQRLEELQHDQRIGADAYMILQEELDFADVNLSTEDERHIEES
jgi:CPA1 family monovalent cation:H+ antiporter